MSEYLVESWHYNDPQRRTYTGCDSRQEAQKFAEKLANEGEDSIIYRLEESRMGRIIDQCEDNGVQAGGDFPVTLSRTAA